MLRILIFSLFLLSSFASQACHFDKVDFKSNFSGGRLDECKKLADDRYLLTLKPENTPINDSPWYAFKITAKQASTITLVMKVNVSNHRYPPKISRDGKHWKLLDYKLNKNKKGNNKLTMKVHVDNKPTWISAQELITNQDYYLWGEKLAKKTAVKQSIIGWSVQKRPLFKLATQGPGNEWLVLLGRQHPPELTGAMALKPFVETILAKTTLATKFRQRFNLFIVPDVNPDGVYLGNWRHNANGFDLNRDWVKFSQPETAAVNTQLLALQQQGQKIQMAIDFHSTRHSIFYTMPSDYDVEDPHFVERWLNALDKQYGDFKVKQKPGNNPDLGVFKQYIADTFKVHAITYEMGDNTDRVFINKLAKSAANQLMKAMLAKPVLKTTANKKLTK